MYRAGLCGCGPTPSPDDSAEPMNESSRSCGACSKPMHTIPESCRPSAESIGKKGPRGRVRCLSLREPPVGAGPAEGRVAGRRAPRRPGSTPPAAGSLAGAVRAHRGFSLVRGSQRTLTWALALQTAFSLA